MWLRCTKMESFIEEWCLNCVTDSSNDTDAFLRNRLRHHVMPLLKQENPKLAENVSEMALRLRQDEACLASLAEDTRDVERLKTMPPALRSRALERFLKESGIREPEAAHIAQLEALIFSEKPSAKICFPGGITIARNYGTLEMLSENVPIAPVAIAPGETVELPGYRVSCEEAREIINTADTFTVIPSGPMVIRSRQPGDTIRLSGGSKSLKKLFIDKKIPAAQRLQTPVIADGAGILGVYSIGANMDRRAEACPAVQIRIEKI